VGQAHRATSWHDGWPPCRPFLPAFAIFARLSSFLRRLLDLKFVIYKANKTSKNSKNYIII